MAVNEDTGLVAAAAAATEQPLLLNSGYDDHLCWVAFLPVTRLAPKLLDVQKRPLPVVGSQQVGLILANSTTARANLVVALATMACSVWAADQSRIGFPSGPTTIPPDLRTITPVGPPITFSPAFNNPEISPLDHLSKWAEDMR